MSHLKWIRPAVAAAISLLGVGLALVPGSAIFRTSPHLRPLALASIEKESDAPPPGYLMRRFGFGNAPAAVEAPLAPEAPSAPAAASNWVSLGPTQIVDQGSNSIYEPSLGRVNCVAISPADPNRILAGAGSGGVWISGDGGQVWTPRGDNLPVLGVTDIKFAPSAPNIVYMTTGDADAFATPSIGVYKSTDGGLTWNPTGLVFNQPDFRIMSKLAVHPANPNIVYAVEMNAIYKTTDGGATWNQLHPSGTCCNDFPSYDVKLRPGNPSVVYAMGPDGAFRRSQNDGASWDPIPPGLPSSSAVQRCQIAVAPNDGNVVYVICSDRSTNGLNGVYRSTDGGSSFSATSGTSGARADFGNQATYDISIAVSPTNSSQVFIGGVTPLRSDNAGASWQVIRGPNTFPGPVVHVDVHDLQINGGSLFAATDGGLHRSTDGGATWTDLSQRLVVAQIYHFSITEQNPGLIYTGEQDNGLNRFSGGKWEHSQVGDWGQPVIHPQSTDLVFAGSNGGDVKTVDGFQNFVIPLNVTSERSNFPGATFAVDPNDLHVAYAGYQNFFKSVDFGDSGTWNKMTSFTDNMTFDRIAVAPSNTQVIYASRSDFFSSMVIRSTTGGSNFGIVSGNGLPNKTVNSIAIDPANPDRVWVALQNSPGQTVFRTVNGGASWTNYTGSLATTSAHTIVYRQGSNDAVFVGTNAGVFARDAADADWTPFNTNLPNAVVSDLAINYASGELRAATYGRGVWKTLLPGTTLNALLNISTRLQVGTGDNILIGGFILSGPGNKTVILRAIGPSLSGIIPGAMADPTLELRNAAGNIIGTNDNWKVTNVGGVITGNQFFAIKSSGVAPANDNESAIVASLPPGNYTAVLRGANNSTGIAVIEGYDLTQATAKFGNISTRGFVQTGNGAMIGGFIIGNQTTRVVVRAIGPSLGQFGVPTPLANPTLELRDSNGSLLDSNDNWKTRPDGSSQQADIQATGLAPTNDLESAIVRSMPPGAYTGIVRGVNNGTGNAVVEAYNLQ
jgi:photosystem II stability/assembly factor-like uncharacterized protein